MVTVYVVGIGQLLGALHTLHGLRFLWRELVSRPAELWLGAGVALALALGIGLRLGAGEVGDATGEEGTEGKPA